MNRKLRPLQDTGSNGNRVGFEIWTRPVRTIDDLVEDIRWATEASDKIPASARFVILPAPPGFCDSDVDAVMTAIHETTLRSRLCLAFAASAKWNAMVIETLERHGVHTILDDVGQVLSASCLTDLPVEGVRFSGAFMGVAANDAIASAMLRSMVVLSHDLGLVTIAGGAIRSPVRQFAETMDIDYVSE